MQTRVAAALGSLLFLVLAGCSGGGGGGGGGGAKSLEFRTHTSFSDDDPMLSVTNASGDTIDYFGTEDSEGNPKYSQAVVTSDDRTVRVFFDENRAITRIQDETSGAFVLVHTLDNGQLYRIYDADGAYQGGFALLTNEDGTHAVAEEIGQSAIDGQLTLTLTPVNGVAQSATLVPVSGSGLGTPAPLPANLEDFLATGTLAKLSIGELMDTVGRSGITSMLVGGALVAGEIAGVVTLTPAAVAIAGTLAVVGGSAALLGYVYPAIVNDALDQLDVPGGGDFVERVVSHLGDSVDELVGEMRTQASHIVDTGSAILGNSEFEVDDGPATVLPDSQWEDLLAQLAPTTEPEVVDTPVEGFGVDQNSNTYTYTGTAYDTGAVVAEADGSDGSRTSVTGTLEETGDFSGSWQNDTGGTVNGFGNATGTEEAFGECESVQNAGNQGTFSFAYNMGSSDGTVTFSYDAYTIPDGFDVFNGGTSVFSTGGLVSGSSAVDIALSSAFVYVNVSAPDSSTAWTFQITCPQ